MPLQVAFIGFGKIGSAVAALVKTSGAKICAWDKDPAKVPHQRPLSQVVPGADVLFFCLPSWHMREAVTEVRPYLSKKTIVVTVAKGMESRSKKTMDRLYDELLPQGQARALLYGPMLADELSTGLMGAAVAAAKSQRAHKTIRRLFAKSRLRLKHSTDLHGVALCGVLKNVYSIGLGIVNALELGGNAKGWFVERIVDEMRGILRRLNRGRDDAALGPAGLGDMVCTGTSAYSNNYRVGQELVAGRRLKKISEGFASLPPLLAVLGHGARRFPLLMAIKSVVISKKKARSVFEEFIRRG